MIWSFPLLCLWMPWRHFPASKLVTLKQRSLPIYARFHPVTINSPYSQRKGGLSYTLFPWCLCVSALNRQMQIKQCMSIPLWGCEMGRSFVTHSCNHTHGEHPVYLARPLMIGCGVSAHYWQLGIPPVEHAFPMTNIQRARGTRVYPLCPSTAPWFLQK